MATMDSLPDKAQELTSKMLGLDLWVVLHTPLVPWDDLAPVLPEHLEWMIGLEESGHLFASGPLIGAAGELPGRGLSILRAENLEDAQAIADTDPFVRRGLRSIEVIHWRLMEGSISMKVGFSFRSGSVS